MKKLLFIVFLFATFSLEAQVFPSQVWHEGKVVLLDGETLKGLVKYDLDNDLVQINSNNRVQTYSSRKILKFEIFDEGFNAYRLFYALPYKVKPNYETPILFEILYEGPLSLLCREFIVQENMPQYGYYPRFGGMSRMRLSYEYYFLKENGEIDLYVPKKTNLLHVMRKRSSEIKSYMKKNRLRYDRREDLAKTTAYYNSLN
ncbi:MAG: hypothetical protein M3512_16605 [Bacteroidota bacterium]|nr:hypothetical protein [Bacteroidota bacterium]